MYILSPKGRPSSSSSSQGWSTNHPVTTFEVWEPSSVSPQYLNHPPVFPPQWPSGSSLPFHPPFSPLLLSLSHLDGCHHIKTSPLIEPPLLSQWSYKPIRSCFKSVAISHHFKDKVPTPQYGMPGTSWCHPVFFSNLFSCQNPCMLQTSQPQNPSQFP